MLMRNIRKVSGSMKRLQSVNEFVITSSNLALLSYPKQRIDSRSMAYMPLVISKTTLPFTTIAELQQNACEKYAEHEVFGTRVGDKFEWIKYKEFGVMVQHFRNVLTSQGIKKNDKVALISNNRVEWAVAMYATSSICAQLVPMYESQLEKDWKFIVENSGSKLLLTGSESVYHRAKDFVGNVGDVRGIIGFDLPFDHAHSYKGLMAKAAAEAPVPPAVVTPDDHQVLIYTSGTTGNPKGVTLSHRNVVAMLRGTEQLWGDGLLHQRSLAFLPWAHVYGQASEMHSLIGTGSAMGIVSNRELIVDSIGVLKPTMICAVPMLFNKVYDGVWKKVNEEGGLKKTIFLKAMEVSRKRNALLAEGKSPGAFLNWKFKIFDAIVFKKIRERLGGNLQFLLGGGAATSVPVMEFFEDIGIPVCEGYGLTETSPVISTSTPGWANRRLGCVGVGIGGIDLRILDPSDFSEVPDGQDGEICCSGDSVMVGYHNNQAANDEVFIQKDGKRFFRTGDMGRLIEGRFLKITGRIKEQYKLENGKFVVPAPLEDMLTRSQFIAQSYVYGYNKPYNLALIVPDFVELKPWAKKNGVKCDVDNLAELIKDPAVKSLLTEEIIKVSAPMKGYERPRVWLATHEPFTPDNFMLTPKLSLRRNNVHNYYKDAIESAFAGSTEGPIGLIPKSAVSSGDE